MSSDLGHNFDMTDQPRRQMMVCLCMNTHLKGFTQGFNCNRYTHACDETEGFLEPSESEK